MYADLLDNGILRATCWTFETTYKEAEARLPRCSNKTCDKPTRFYKYFCTFHAPSEDDSDLFRDEDPSSLEIARRAHRAFPNNPELAAEAAERDPGSFM